VRKIKMGENKIEKITSITHLEANVKTLQTSISEEKKISLPRNSEFKPFQIISSYQPVRTEPINPDKRQEVSCQDVAKYFLSLTDEDAGDLISNLKLQKLVYYAQGFHLALFDKPLFKETIEAWIHGPVTLDLYHIYKRYGNQGIPIPEYIDFLKYPENIKNLLDEIYSVYGQFSAWKLRNMTHMEPPWREARESNKIISNFSLKKYFLTQIEDDIEDGEIKT